jgi:periplasmic copper chaperone A
VHSPRSAYVAALVIAAGVIIFAACGQNRPSVLAQSAWVSAAPMGDTAVVSMILTNRDPQPIDIVDVLSTSARTVAMFQHVRDGDTVRTALLPRLAIPGGTSSTFMPPGPHIMLAGLQRELRQGDHVTVTVILADGHPINVDAVVRPTAAVIATHADIRH